MRWSWILLLAGCRSILGIEEATVPSDGTNAEANSMDGDASNAEAGGCPAGFMRLGSLPHCFRVVTATGSWQAQRDFCASLSAYLAIPDTSLELLGLDSFATTNYWLGITDITNENTFTTVLGTVQTYLPWASGQPNDGGSGEDCVESHRQLQIFDAACNITQAAICEYDN